MPVSRVLSLLLAVAYPLLVFAAVHWWSLAGLGVLALVAGALRMALVLLPWAGSTRQPDVAAGLLILSGLLILLTGDVLAARMYPVLVNLTMLGLFAWSLLYPPTAVERLARLSTPDLPVEAIGYTRRVTQVWCVFFILNASVAWYTAMYSSIGIWTLYNGLLAYLAMGLLFAVEYLVRLRVMRRHAAQEPQGD